jgi:hypothetical protein
MLSIKEKMTKILDSVTNHIKNNPEKLIRDSYADTPDPEDLSNFGNKRCSVSRFMTGEDISNLAKAKRLNACIDRDHCWDLVKSKKIKELPREFWAKIQSLNDSELNWDECGLTTRGELKVETIRGFIKGYKG